MGTERRRADLTLAPTISQMSTLTDLSGDATSRAVFDSRFNDEASANKTSDHSFQEPDLPRSHGTLLGEAVLACSNQLFQGH
jgi:hypothetical protein